MTSVAVTNGQTHLFESAQASLTQDTQSLEEEQFAALFCRANYDYEAQDASALSFRKDDIIEVLTQQPSGWWDGLLGDERGWFPSNYVTVISEEEAELAFSEAEMAQQTSASAIDSMVDMSQALGSRMSPDGEVWLDEESGSVQDDVPEHPPNPVRNTGQSSDFWMPEVTLDGQIYYVNTQTGQRSRDLPQETDSDPSEVNELAGLTSQSSSRLGTTAGLGLSVFTGSNDDAAHTSTVPGFGLPKRSGTPEPWTRRLADDGRSYYYLNSLDGSVQWTRPEALQTVEPTPAFTTASTNGIPPIIGRLRSESTTSQLEQPFGKSNARRMSVYSDTSDVQPPEMSRLNSQQSGSESKNFQSGPSSSSVSLSAPSATEETIGSAATSMEHKAHILQRLLAPPPPELVADLSESVHRAIQSVIHHVQTTEARWLSEGETMEILIRSVVQTVRELLYVSAAPTGQIPKKVYPGEQVELQIAHPVQAALKPAQRKVTATLSKLVLSARAVQYEAGLSQPESPNRMEGDAEELDRAVMSFVAEVQRSVSVQSGVGFKRLRAVFSPSNIGPGLYGGGSGGSWRGFGWVHVEEVQEINVRILGPELVSEIGLLLPGVDAELSTLSAVLQNANVASGDVERIQAQSQITISRVSAFINFIINANVARHVDIDGIGSGSNTYMQLVLKARGLARTLENSLQSVYDDNSLLLLTIQRLRHAEPEYALVYDLIGNQMTRIASALKANIVVVCQTLEALVTVGQDQSGIAHGDYLNSIEWRLTRLSVIENKAQNTHIPSEDDEDVVGMADAFRKPSTKVQTLEASYFGIDSSEGSTLLDDDPVLSQTQRESDEIDNGLLDDDDIELDEAKAIPRAKTGNKILQVMGRDVPQHILNTVNADAKPWYLRPNNDPSEIQIEPDGTVRGGTVPALVEHLTSHDAANPQFIKAFLMTFKSFTSIDELFELLVQRFRITPPPSLTEIELADWAKLKQHVIQMRVLNTFKTMVTDDDVLEKDDAHILDRIKDFISADEVSRFAAAKQLMILLDRGRGRKVTALQTPPPPIIPKTSKKLKLLDIDPLELARQLTIVESELFQKIRPIECLERPRGGKAEHNDSIARVIQTSNRIADWVAESVLSKDDSRRRAATLKQFIAVADRCRALHNFSTMVAITSGLNTPPISRLKRTWEHVPPKVMAQFASCEAVMESTKNYKRYQSAMGSISPPCVPFIGVFLTTLQFIHDGGPDQLGGNQVNFRKRQKASEVIQDIKRWQAQPFHFTPIPHVLTYIHDSLNSFSEGEDVRERFWNISLEREPREREDERMARLLQESGFL